MKQLTHRQYDALESAITHGRRVAIYRRGTEFVGVPIRLWSEGQREAVAIVHPTTGEEIIHYLDEIERLEVMPG